jgi:DNA topoisomerase-1
LVVVESPAKARTIEKYLGRGFKVAASVGHVVDLPRKELGVDIENDFKPSYEVMPEKKKAVSALKNAAKDADEIFLAPDPDREGEAIAWHIANLLRKSGRPMRRMLINEITRPAVLKAIEEAGDIDQNRFEAQQARRVLDRLVGYLISPMLSKKFRQGLSAGRVQSVALRLVVERERAIRSFEAKEYWSIEARLEAEDPPEFKARLVAISGKGLEPPEKFDRDNNAFVAIDDKKHTHIPDEDSAARIVEALSGRPFVVHDVDKQERRRNPLPPFITSTLQQEAARKLGFTAKKTMTIAQRLYEGQDVGEGAVGLITYMRTDSPRIANEAADMIRGHIKAVYGDKFLPDRARMYKSRKGAQEAHEAIRPTSTERTPEAVKPHVDKDMHRLYELIFQRAVASQMKPAVYDQTTVEIPVGEYLFRAGGRVIKFKGFLAVYEEAQDEDVEKSEDMPLPPLNPGDKLKANEIVPEKHITKAPPRFTEASLVKELEERGIGRPSTYASILSTIQDRKYVEKQKRRFAPTELGERVTKVLLKAFPDILEVEFTARMENNLDKVEDGEENWVNLLRRFYGPFSERLAQAPGIIEDARQEKPTDIPCPLCGKELMIRWSKQGEFLGCSGYPECRFTSDFTRDDNREIKMVKRPEDEDAGIACEKCGKPMVIKRTRKDGSEFLGCSGYPKCKNTMDFIRDEQGKIEVTDGPRQEDTGISCEKCGKPMVIRKTRRDGREFLGCSGYPKCKNTGDFLRDGDGKIRMVVPGDEGEPCRKCGSPTILKRGRYGTYWACDNTACEKSKAKASKKAPAKKKEPEPLPDEPPCEKCGKPMVRKTGRYGPFIACSGYPECKNIRKKKDGKAKSSEKAESGNQAS